MRLSFLQTAGVMAVYVFAVLSVMFQLAMVLGDPAVPDYYSAAVQAHIQASEHRLWGVIAALVVVIVVLTVFLFKGKRTAGWVAAPGAALSLAFPALFAAFRISDFVHALHS